MLSRRIVLIIALTVAALASSADIKAQTSQHQSPSQELFSEIGAMDSIMFRAFNAGDIDKLKTLFTKDVEFYHDRSGLTS